jgi:hypothetical protein
VKGWVSPKPGSQLFNAPLNVIRNSVPVKGKLVVVEMRYFVGPESPPSDKVEILSVERWYVKLYAAHDIRFQGRFLVERRVFGSGVSAVAAYDTKGFNSPDWRGFQWNSEDLTRRAYPGLPGRWPGSSYDFVKGTPPQGVRVHGLPDQALGCMAGT